MTARPRWPIDVLVCVPLIAVLGVGLVACGGGADTDRRQAESPANSGDSSLSDSSTCDQFEAASDAEKRAYFRERLAQFNLANGSD